MLFSKSTFIALSQGMKIFKITSYLSSSLCIWNLDYLRKNDQNANFSLYFKMIAFSEKDL